MQLDNIASTSTPWILQQFKNEKAKVIRGYSSTDGK